jgi:hypothetical protein
MYPTGTPSNKGTKDQFYTGTHIHLSLVSIAVSVSFVMKYGRIPATEDVPYFEISTVDGAHSTT